MRRNDRVYKTASVNQFRLAGLEFIKEHKDVFITGSTGTGKSYLATALGYHACQNGYKVMYVNTAKLMGQLKLAKAKEPFFLNSSVLNAWMC